MYIKKHTQIMRIIQFFLCVFIIKHAAICVLAFSIICDDGDEAPFKDYIIAFVWCIKYLPSIYTHTHTHTHSFLLLTLLLRLQCKLL